MSDLGKLWSRLFSVVTRTKVTAAKMGTVRTALNLKSLEGEAFTNIALQLPMGMSAVPGVGADVIVLEVNGNRDHKVALYADDPALRIKDLKPGEFGFSDKNGNRVVFRADTLEVTAKTVPIVVKAEDGQKIQVIADHVEIQGEAETLRKLVTDKLVAKFNSHVHGASGPPTPQMNDSDLTDSVRAGGAA